MTDAIIDDVPSKPIGNHKVNVLIGVVGMAIIIYGNLLPATTAQKLCYLFGGIIMMVSALLEKQSFFIILQVIIVSGAAIAFAPMPAIYRACVPILLSIIAIAHFAMKGELSNKTTLLGNLGIVFLAAGYAITNPVIYFIGGALLSIYSLISFKQGVKIAILWAILNIIFSATALVSVFAMAS